MVKVQGVVKNTDGTVANCPDKYHDVKEDYDPIRYRDLINVNIRE